MDVVNNNQNNENGDDNSYKSTKSLSTSTAPTTDTIVMEMVEAIIDNNNNNNNFNNNNNRKYDDGSVYDGSDVNLWKIKSENEIVQNADDDNLVLKLHKSTNEQQSTVNSADNVERNREGNFQCCLRICINKLNSFVTRNSLDLI